MEPPSLVDPVWLEIPKRLETVPEPEPVRLLLPLRAVAVTLIEPRPRRPEESVQRQVPRPRIAPAGLQDIERVPIPELVMRAVSLLLSRRLKTVTEYGRG